MGKQKQEKVMASVIWLLLLFATGGMYQSGYMMPAYAMTALLVVFGIAITRMPPKGLNNALNEINPNMDDVIWVWFIPFLVKHWKIVLLLLAISLGASLHLFSVTSEYQLSALTR